jgi:hypothetical protein
MLSEDEGHREPTLHAALGRKAACSLNSLHYAVLRTRLRGASGLINQLLHQLKEPQETGGQILYTL